MGVIEKQSIQDIADAIRDRNGLTTLYKPRQMDEAIRGLYKTEAVNHVFDNLTVSTTVQGTSFTITDADATKQAEITEIKGNTTQEGTPTPSSPVEVKTVSGDNEVVVSNKNLFNSNYNDYDLSGLYGYIKVTEENTDYVISLIEKDSSISLSGIYFGWTKNGFNASAGLNWVINNGNLVSGPKINKQGQVYLGCISFYPKNETTFNKIISKYDIQLEKRNTSNNLYPT